MTKSQSSGTQVMVKQTLAAFDPGTLKFMQRAGITMLLLLPFEGTAAMLLDRLNWVGIVLLSLQATIGLLLAMPAVAIRVLGMLLPGGLGRFVDRLAVWKPRIREEVPTLDRRREQNAGDVFGNRREEDS